MKRCTWLAIQICRMFKHASVWVAKIYIFYRWIDTNWMTAYIKKSVQFHISYGKKERRLFDILYVCVCLCEFYVKLCWSIIVNFSLILFFFFCMQKKTTGTYNSEFFFLSFIISSHGLLYAHLYLEHNFHIQTTHKTSLHRSNNFSFNILISFDYFCNWGSVKVPSVRAHTIE